MRNIYFVHLNCNANLFFWVKKKSIIVYPVLKSTLKKPNIISIRYLKKRYATNNQMKLHLRFFKEFKQNYEILKS